MHHAAAAELDPAGVLADAATALAEGAADVELEAGLDEGEVPRPQPHLELLLEELPQEPLQHAGEVSDGDVLADDQPFHLVEGVLVGGVRLLVAEHAPGRDHPEGRREALHRPDLHRRGLRAHHQVPLVIAVEGVLHLPRRVVGGDVERLEVVVVKLDLGTVEHRVAHRDEDLLDLAAHLRQGVERAPHLRCSGQGGVEAFALALGGEPRFLEGSAARLDRRLDLLLEQVGPLADDATLLRGQARDRREQLGHRALLADELAVDGAEGLGITGGLDARQRLGAQLFQTLFHQRYLEGAAGAQDWFGGLEWVHARA